jgi:gas vesicle protein
MMENVVNRTQHEMHDMRRDMQNSRTGKTFANIVIGTIIGAVAGLLFAPKSGSQIRKEIAKQASQWGDQATKITDQASKFTDQASKAARKRADKLADRAHMPDLRKMTMRKRNTGGKMWLGILIGSAVGAGAALLFAPKSGRQMRQQLKREADELGTKASNLARETADQARHKAKEMANEAEGEMRRQKEIMEDVNNRDYPL